MTDVPPSRRHNADLVRPTMQDDRARHAWVRFMKHKHTGSVVAPTNHDTQIKVNQDGGAEALRSATVNLPVEHPTGHLPATWRDARPTANQGSLESSLPAERQEFNRQRAGILEPLVQLLEERHANSMEEYPVDRIAGAFGDGLFVAEAASADSVMIKLPYDCSYHDATTKTVAAILYRTSSDGNWLWQDGDQADSADPCRGPLRFCLVKKAIWVSVLERFVPAFRLSVDTLQRDADTARRQVEALVNYLRAGAPLFHFVDDDYMLF